jgi:hypothetical protein
MSPKDKFLQVRLDTKEREELEKAAQEAGFKNVADYVRYYTIGDGRHIRDDIKKILKKLEIE